MVEQSTVNAQVTGSSPIVPANYCYIMEKKIDVLYAPTTSAMKDELNKLGLSPKDIVTIQYHENGEQWVAYIYK